MNKTDSAQFTASIEQLPILLSWIRGFLEETSLTHSEKQKVEIAVEEAVVNIMHYAYPHRQGFVEIHLSRSHQELRIKIFDKGIPFNPLKEAAPPNIDNSLENRKEGGLGVFLMKKCMDMVHYKRENGQNILTLVKRFSQKR